jgi:hypothetical protein
MVGIPLVRCVTGEREMTPEPVALYTANRPVRDLLDQELKSLQLSQEPCTSDHGKRFPGDPDTGDRSR